MPLTGASLEESLLMCILKFRRPSWKRNHFALGMKAIVVALFTQERYLLRRFVYLISSGMFKLTAKDATHKCLISMCRRYQIPTQNNVFGLAVALHIC